MDNEIIVKQLILWASRNPYIRSVYLFGSRIKGKHGPDSDIDIAIEFDKYPSHTDCMTTWCNQANSWRQEIESLIPAINIDLEWYDSQGSTPVIGNALDDASILIYQR